MLPFIADILNGLAALSGSVAAIIWALRRKP